MTIAQEENEKLSGDSDRQARVVAGREIHFDGEGFFRDATDWSEEVARTLAMESGIEDLSNLQWKVILFFREYYVDHGHAPMNRPLKEGTGLSLAQIESLFPGGIRRGARRLAGLPNPKSCL